MSDNQRIKSGDKSENYQASGDITVNQGISYMEVKDVAMMVFENNFSKLGEQVEALVIERAERIINAYLLKIRTEHPEALVNTIDPDIRAGIYEAQKDFARSGKEDVKKLLVDLLVERTVNVDSDFKNILLNEALSVAAKLNKTQIDLLTIQYIVINLSYNNEVSPPIFEKLLLPFVYLLNSNDTHHSDLHFLSYLGCLSLSIGSRDFDKLLIKKNMVGFSSKEDIQENINEFKILSDLKTFYKLPNNQIGGATITPVGDMIAITNFNKLFNDNKIPYLV